MRKIIRISIIFFTIVCCNKKENLNIENPKIEQNLQENSKPKITRKIQKPNSVKKESDTVNITNQIIVIFEPTDKAIVKRKIEIGEENFYIGADDYMWYINESNEYFKKQTKKVLLIKNNKVLKFVQENGNITFVNLSKEEELWGIYLFDTKLKPKRINMTETEKESNEYFRK